MTDEETLTVQNSVLIFEVETEAVAGLWLRRATI